MSEFFLCNLNIGGNAVIKGYSPNSDLKIKRRLMELGFVIGESVRVEDVSIFKEVMLFSVRGYLISLRKEIAKCIEVEAR